MELDYPTPVPGWAVASVAVLPALRCCDDCRAASVNGPTMEIKMHVYVDEWKAYGPWRYRRWCHLWPAHRTEDGIKRLHRFALNVGLMRDKFQHGTWPHYFLSDSDRYRALQLGACELTMEEYVNWQLHRDGKPGHEQAVERMKQIHAAYNLNRPIA